MDIGKKVKFYRKISGYSLRHLGELSGLHWTSIGNIEENKRIPRIQTLEKICKVLNIPISELME